MTELVGGTKSKTADERAQLSLMPSRDPRVNTQASAEGEETVAAASRHTTKTSDNAHCKFVVDALPANTQSGKLILTSAHATGWRLKHINRVSRGNAAVARRGF